MLRQWLLRKGKKIKGSVFDESFCLSLTDPDFVDDPYRFFSFLRHHQPLHRNDSGAWILTAYDDINAMLKDERLGNVPSSYSVLNKKNADKYVVASVANNIIPFIDVPNHKPLRQAVAHTFSKQLTETMPIVSEIAQKQCQQLSGDTSFDVIADYGTPVSIRVMIKFLGLSEANFNQLKQWSQDFVYLFSFIPSETARQRIDKHLQQFRQCCLADIETKKVKRSNDWLSKMLDLREQEGLRDILTDTVIADHAMLLFADGVENVDRGIGTAINLLLRHPKQLKCLLELPDDGLWKNAINECLRYESPAQFVGRVAKEDISLYGQKIKKDQIVLLMLASANRDESVFESPDMFDIHRKLPFYLSFGRGRHSCVGGEMVRQEIQIAAKTLLHTFPKAKLRAASPSWELRVGHRWLKHLVISI